MSAIQEMTLSAQPTGRPLKLNPELVEKLVEHLSVGNYVKPSCEAAGIDYTTLRAWIVRGEQDKQQGLDTPFSNLLDRLAHAQAAAEASLVDGLRKAEDWRAQAFILERRHRDRWGKDERQQQASVTLQIPESLASVLADALRVASATIVVPSTEVEQASAPLAIEAELVTPTEPSEPSPGPELEQLPDRAITTVKTKRR